MPSATMDGIGTLYEVTGSGPLLMYAPGGFNPVIEVWSTEDAKLKFSTTTCRRPASASLSSGANAPVRPADRARHLSASRRAGH
jgi:hypothetical protein